MNPHSLPNGKTTRNSREYINAWREFAKPICEVTNTILYAFDPGISIRTKEPHSSSLDLPRWFVIEINKAIELKKEEEE